MEYIIVTALLFMLMLAYFKIADRYNIIDKPNHRSAHTEITLRGGGIIFPIAYLFFIGSKIIFNQYVFSGNTSSADNFWIFGAGLLIICTISFLDDILDLSSKIRIVFHFIAVTLLLYFLSTFLLLPIWAIFILYVLIIGILNAYNFMDGINGITGLYSLSILGSLLYVNEYVTGFTDKNFIIYPILACLVFLFFNFRKKAKCFMGDVGSMGIAFWVMALIGLLMVKTGELKYIMFLTVYGVEVIFTILERIKLKENIFEAHRRHLYQLLANEKKVSHLVISAFYALLQSFINIMVIYYRFPDWMIILGIALPVILLYLAIKLTLKKEVSSPNI